MKRSDQKPNKFITRLPHETLKKVSSAKTVDERVKILQEDGTFALKTILQVNFRDDINFDFPEGAPPYRKDEMDAAGNQVQSIEKAIRRLSYCVSANKKYPNVKKEQIFITLLETIHPKDAEVLIAMKDKKLKTIYKGLTLATVKKAYPNLKV